MRVGSGGVLLTNHPPLLIAEQFGTLEALHPGRIDLGLGRSAGTDAATSALLRAGAAPEDDFEQKLTELTGYFAGPSFGRLGSPVKAVPAAENRPPIWLLGSSVSSALTAAGHVQRRGVRRVTPRDPWFSLCGECF
ncbi:hypothetical protein FDG2_2420 [Candidatus Protofrankia californiensis]|uniref:Luciferase-like domain-containing protein n=1 Tax=Candidatus Protofrankia californiensis TaxID=1839754 RepID=A0A1C3NXM4_9ACTN|nr:LLM class flavin-dependent oxidoreductase [Protofrankia symbiont of Coriaria ruscifolia]SBW22287.1 hypothetical protein FDG2_2420 [Candidatus Protofrankia californiensis]